MSWRSLYRPTSQSCNCQFSVLCLVFHITTSHFMSFIKGMWDKLPELFLEESGTFLNSKSHCQNQLQFKPSLSIISVYWVSQTNCTRTGSFPVHVQWFDWPCSRLERLWSSTVPRATTLLSTDRARRVHCANTQIQWACLNRYSYTWGECLWCWDRTEPSQVVLLSGN